MFQITLYNLSNIPLDLQTSEHIGGKALGLCHLQAGGFRVPSGWVLPSTLWEQIAKHNQIEQTIASILLGEASVADKSKQLQELVDDLEFPEVFAKTIEETIDPAAHYAVRSSGTLEDLEDHSFAGQYETVLGAQGEAAVMEGIRTCYRSLYSKTVLSYLENSGQIPQVLSMALVIQEIVEADTSGVAFSLNPITGADTEYVIEVVNGLGNSLVDGKAKPSRYQYDWYKEKYTAFPNEDILLEKERESLLATIGEVTRYYGYPVDIEFSFQQGVLFLLQARAVTKIRYSGLKDIWTTANFKDGGVSASVCTPFMWSLYEYIWEISFKNFLVDSHFISEKNMRKAGAMFYGRPYWNLSIAKEAMAKVPGYKEREFDKEFGIGIHYEGNGAQTTITPKSIASIVRIAAAQRKLLKRTLMKARGIQETLLQQYEAYRTKLSSLNTTGALEIAVQALIQQDYLQSGDTYFTQIFINTVHQTLFRNSILNYVDEAGYFALISGLDDISHLRPIYHLWKISRHIRQDGKAVAYWLTKNSRQIAKDLQANKKHYFLPEVSQYLAQYGYHSEKELDITFPCYEDDYESTIRELCQLVGLEDSYSPMEDQKRQKRGYQKELVQLEQKVGARKAKKLIKKIETMRELLWWREEFRDITTRFYCIIRQYILALAAQYHKEGILQQVEDIWFITIGELWQYLDGVLSQEELKRRIRRHQDYYNSYRNYRNENEIGADYVAVPKRNKEATVIGFGANTGIVTGRARVIESLEEIDRLETDDILIARFTDTGWTSKFVVIKGLVTEHGGVLCHAAIVSREYGIPCIVCAEDATKRIPDGSTITINGLTGEILLH